MGAWVTQKCHHFTRSALDKAVEGRKHVLGTFQVLQGCNSQEVAVTRHKINNVTWPEVTGSVPGVMSFHRKLFGEVASFDRKSPGNGCRRLKTWALRMFQPLQDCNSLEVAVSRHEMTSRDLM